ncbi:MAG TPA: Rab family GTPase [Candidatus Lokiarchaeia archaeon]|nr:Rab family GTPase [Candidatus Lokiarchaeia archaeon]
MVASNEGSSKVLVKGLIYANFDEKLGPISQTWLPIDLSIGLREKVPMVIYNLGSSTQEVPKGLAVIPVPGMSMKALVHFITFDDEERRGGIGEGAVICLIDESNDVIFYRYIKQFEDLFNKHASAISALLENKAKERDISAEVGSLSEELSAIIDSLKDQELSRDAFPADEELDNNLKCKVAVIGDANVGKTSFVMQFTEKAFRRSYLPTIGVNISEKTISHEGRPVKFVIWDVAGQVKFQRMRKHFYAGSTAVIFVFDLTNKESLNSIKGWYEDVKKSIGDTFMGSLLGNKCDLVEQIVISPDEGEAVARELNLSYFQTSALTSENIDAVFHHYAEAVISQSSR